MARLGAGALTGASVAALGFAQGGYYATAWGWASVAALGLAGWLLHRGAGPAAPGLLMTGAFGALLVWTALAAARPGEATSGAPEVQRDLLYLALISCAILVVRASTVDGALAGCLFGTVALSGAGLVDLLLPAHASADLYEGRLLFRPVGYANAMGILAACGLLLAVGVAACEPGRWLRTAAVGAAVPLAVALELSESRGAEVAALVAVAALLAVGARRRAYAIALVVSMPVPLAAAVVAARSQVGDPAASGATVLHDGRVVALVVVTATLLQAALALRLWPRVTRGVERLALPGICVSLAVIVPAAAVLAAGRLAGERASYWRVAWAVVRGHPLLGSGPGSFAAEWLRLRPDPTNALNAHNLYLETLAELGPVGLLLLLVFLGIPLVCAARVRRDVHPGALAAYVALVVHGALDWDWQLPVVVAVEVVCAAALLAPIARQPLTARTRRLGLACTALAAVVAAMAAIGASALAAAGHDEAAGSWASAGRLAALASRWEPWSSTPVRVEAEAAAAQGQRPRARRLFLEASARDPRDWLAWYGLLRVGTPAERRAAVARIVVLNPLAVRRRR